MTATEPAVAAAGAGGRLGVVGTVVVLGGVMTVLDVTIANVALAPLAAELDADLPQVQWVSSAYALTLAAVMPASRWAMDRFGARTVYLTALAVFVVASGLAALAPDLGWLVAFRVLQALGGGLLAPTGMTMIFRAAGPERLATATRVLGLPLLVAPLLGPVVGGLLVDALSWRALFAVNVPIGLGALALGLARMPADRPEDGRTHRLDVLALLLLSPGVALLALGLTGVSESGGGGPTLLFAVTGLALVAGFVARTWPSAHPLLDLTLLRRRSVGPAIAAAAVFACGYFGSMFLAPLYYQLVRGTSVAESGLLLLPWGVASAVTLQFAAGAVARFGAARVVRCGIPTALVGLTAFVWQLAPDASLVGLSVALAVMGVGVGSTLMPAVTAANTGLAPDEVPSVNTVFQVTGQLAAALGTALVAVVLSAGLAAAIPGTAAADGLTAARSLPPELLHTTTALVDGFRMAYLVAIALFALAWLLSIALRHTPGSTARPDLNSRPSAGEAAGRCSD